MKLSLDLRGLPEPIAEALVQLVEAIRKQSATSAPIGQPPASLPVWEGMCVKPWNRADLYEEYLDKKFPPREAGPGPVEEDASSRD